MDAQDTQVGELLKQCDYLWGEYQYRHDLIWKRTFTFTTVITAISIIPYLHTDIVCLLGNKILLAPVLACLLALFGLLLMSNELRIFGIIKKEYREKQNQLFGKELHNPNRNGKFKLFVTGYLICLLLLSSFNLYIVGQFWIPEVLQYVCELPH